MSIQRSEFTLTATSVLGVVTPSAVRALPKGADLAGVQVNVSSTAYNGGTIQPVLEGSNNATDFVAAVEGTGTAFGADGFEMLGAADQVLPLGQFLSVRLSFIIAGGPPDDGTVVAVVKMDYETG